MHHKLIVHSYAVNLRFMWVWPRCRLAKVIKRLASLIRRWGDWAAGPQWRSGDSWQCESGSQARARGEEEVTQDADENILEVCHFQGEEIWAEAKYETWGPAARPSWPKHQGGGRRLWWVLFSWSCFFPFFPGERENQFGHRESLFSRHLKELREELLPLPLITNQLFEIFAKP